MSQQLQLNRLIIVLFFSVCLLSSVYSQNNQGTDQFSTLKLQLDKKYFLPGETVFFNAFFLSSDTVQDKSCTVVLIDEKKNILQSKELLFNNYRAASFFVLPAIDTAKFYTIQYYLNSYSTPVIYAQYIFSALSDAALQNQSASPDVNFFPEADHLAAGLPAVVFCKFTGLPSSAFPLDAAVVSDAGDTLSMFTTTSAGAGKIELGEVPAKPVYISYQYAHQTFTKEIPVSFSPGSKTIFNLYPMSNSVVYRIRTLVSDSFMLKIENEGMVYYYVSMYLNEGDDFGRPLKSAQIKPGINIFHLYDQSGKEIASRSFYMNAPAADSLHVKKVSLQPEQTIKVELDKKLTGNFSVSVHRLLQKDNGQLPADEGKDKVVEDDINMQASVNAYKATLAKPADSLAITLQDEKDGKPVANAAVNLMVRSAGDNFLISKNTNSSGQVTFYKSTITDSASVVFFLTDKAKPKTSLAGSYEPAKIFTNASLYMPPVDVSPTTPDVNALSLSTFKTKTLQEVVVKTRTKYRNPTDSIEQTYASGMFISGVHNVAKFDLINDKSIIALGDVASYLSGRLIKEEFGRNGIASALDGYFVYLNENLIQANEVSNIQLSDVAFISVTDRNFLTMSTFGPTVLIYTKKGKDIERNVQTGTTKINSLKIKGFASPGTYFNPLFDNKQVEDKFRNTLFWNSSMILNNAGELQLKLAAKPLGPVEISIMGFDENGDFISLKKIVEKPE